MLGYFSVSGHLTEEEKGTITMTLNTAILIQDNPPNSDMDYKIFNVCMCIFLHKYT